MTNNEARIKRLEDMLRLDQQQIRDLQILTGTLQQNAFSQPLSGGGGGGGSQDGYYCVTPSSSITGDLAAAPPVCRNLHRDRLLDNWQQHNEHGNPDDQQLVSSFARSVQGRSSVS